MRQPGRAHRQTCTKALVSRAFIPCVLALVHLCMLVSTGAASAQARD